MSQVFAERNNFKLSIDFFSELISLGADVNYQNIPGETPLYLAVWAPNIELATLLLEKGAKINAITAGNDQTLEGEETPLMMAVRQDNIEMTQLLLSHNADPTMKNSNGKTVVTMVKSDAMLNILIPLQPYNDLLNQFPKIIQQYMKWTAFPKISEQKIAQNIVKAKDSIKGLNFDKLTQNPEIKRTLFNLIFYMNTLPAKNKKKEELQKFITELSNVSLEDASKMCSTALKDNDILVKNRAIFGGYKFFHSLPNKIINKIEMTDWPDQLLKNY